MAGFSTKWENFGMVRDMGQKNVRAIWGAEPRAPGRPKTLGGPIGGAEQKLEALALLNAPEPMHGVFRTRTIECAYSVARCPIGSGPNEDSLLIVPSKNGCFLVVADGAGGHPEGEKASALAVTELGERLTSLDASRSPQSIIIDGFDAASHRIATGTRGALTTLLVVQVEQRLHGLHFRTFHAGDSAALVFSGRGQVRFSTVMHSPVGYAVESGWLDPDLALHHEALNLVSSLVGGPDMRLEIGPWVTLRPRETLLVATDGLLDNVYRRELGQAARGKLEVAEARLSALARTRMLEPGSPLQKPDDCSFVLLRARPTGHAI